MPQHRRVSGWRQPCPGAGKVRSELRLRSLGVGCLPSERRLRMADKAKVLVVANQTAESEELLAALKARGDHGSVEFTVLIPATPHGVSWAADMHAGGNDAGYHRDALVDRLRSIGLDVTEAKVGDGDALAAIQDEVNFNDYDELIVSTLPRRISKWLHVDLPSKAEAATGLPVLHITARGAKVPAS